MTPPGWYADPAGYWELRWFDGTGWTPRVATGAYQSDDPYPPTPPSTVDPSTVIFGVDGTHEREPMQVRLTGAHLGFVPGRRPHETRWIPLGFVTGVAAEKAATADGVGNLRVLIRGPGYIGPALYLVTGIPAVHATRALILRQRAVAAGIAAAAG